MTSGKPLDRTDGSKRCPRCQEVKPFPEFNRDRHRSDGLSSYCRVCTKESQDEYRNKPGAREAAIERARQWRKDNQIRQKANHLRTTYGISVNDYATLFMRQGGKCAICGAKEAGGRGEFHVDHCHETKKVRGLLCHSCNVSIGHFRHDPTLLRAAADYCEKKGE